MSRDPFHGSPNNDIPARDMGDNQDSVNAPNASDGPPWPQDYADAFNSYTEKEPCGHTKNFLIGDEQGNFSCLVCQNIELVKQRNSAILESTRSYLESPAMDTFADLKNSRSGTVLAMLQDGAISRGKACEVLSLVAHGVPFDEVPLPEENGNQFGEDEIPAEVVNNLKSDNDLLRRQRDYLARSAMIRACITRCDYDPAGSTTEYEPDKEAVELFGEDALYFVIGCGPTPTHYSLNMGRIKK